MWRLLFFVATCALVSACEPSAPAQCPVPAMSTLYKAGPPDPSVAPATADVCERAPHDAIIVLGCPNNTDGSPSDCQVARVALAMQLANAGYAKRFITTGAAAHNAYVEADTLKQLLVDSGVDSADIETDTAAEHTDENIANSSMIMTAHQWKSAIVVSDQPGQFLYEALCDSNCCVERGRLTLLAFPTSAGPVTAGHYVLRPDATASTAAECNTLAANAQCLLLGTRNACAAR